MGIWQVWRLCLAPLVLPPPPSHPFCSPSHRRTTRRGYGIRAAGKKQVVYKLPDGKILYLGPECFRAPELLFQPDLVGYESEGIHQLLIRSILRTDMDLRSALYSNIVLAGGSTLFRGFGDRLLNELKTESRLGNEGDGPKIKILAPQERRYSTWIGGSILGSLSTFSQLWISKEQYNEHGPHILHKRCF